MQLELSQQISKNTKISNFIKICAVGEELLHVERRMHRRDMKLIVAFRNFANTPENMFSCRNIECTVVPTDCVSVAF